MTTNHHNNMGKRIRATVKGKYVDKINVDSDKCEVQIYMKPNAIVTDQNGNLYSLKPGSEKEPMRRYFRPEDVRRIQDALYALKEDDVGSMNHFMDLLDYLEQQQRT
jgi:hypothetical protein